MSEDEETVYNHMMCAPDPVPVRKADASDKNGAGVSKSSSRSTGPASIAGNKRKTPDSSVTSSGWASSSSSRQQRNGVLSLTELAKQHIMPRRYFLVLTSHGLWVLVKNHPINQLYALLRGPDPGSNADIEEFFKQYGLDESCAMCLAKLDLLIIRTRMLNLAQLMTTRAHSQTVAHLTMQRKTNGSLDVQPSGLAALAMELPIFHRMPRSHLTTSRCRAS